MISSVETEDFYNKANALIRSTFKVKNPEKLSIKKYATLYQEAMYLKRLDAELLGRVLNKVLGGDTS